MKIVHIVEAAFAGVGRHALDLAESQAKNNEVTVIYSEARLSDSIRKRMVRNKLIRWVSLEVSRDVGLSDIQGIYQ